MTNDATKRRLAAGAASAIGMTLVLCGCMQPELTSTWLDREITIDGKAPEWAGREAYYSEDEGLKVGFSNDDRYLYVYFSTWHRRKQLQILMNGLTIWIDAQGGKKEAFGVKYPVASPPDDGMRRESPPGDSMRMEKRDDSDSDRARRMDDPAAFKALVTRYHRSELQFVGPDEELIASLFAGDPDSGETGVEAMIDYANRTLIYELRLPLAALNEMPYAIHAGPGETIGIGIKIGQRQMLDRKGTGEGPPEGMEGGPGGMGGGPGGTGGGPGGMGGGPGGGMGGPGDMGARPAAESLALWVKVKLATRPAAPEE